MAGFPDECVDMCVTSPPYWNLRDYGVDGQLGLEKTPEEFISNMVAIFDEVKRVLKPHGTCWLNIGDSYAANRTYQVTDNKHISVGNEKPSSVPDGLKPKDLCLIPFKLAIALQEAGWWVRSDIIWHKRNPMPESVTDRPTKAHEYIFLLTKSAKYYYDAEAVREIHVDDFETFKKKCGANPKYENTNLGGNHLSKQEYNPSGRNLRTVWDITTKGYKGAHFATFPPALPERCIKAGTSEKGNCADCGKPYKRVIEHENMVINKTDRSDLGEHGRTQSSGTMVSPATNKTVGWEKTCKCETDEISKPIVLDPFMGSGTVAEVARKLGRDYLGVELNPKYIELYNERLSQQTLF